MKRKRLDPFSPEFVELMLDEIRNMTAEERMAVLTYRPPGIEETDMTGMLRDHTSNRRSALEQASDKH